MRRVVRGVGLGMGGGLATAPAASAGAVYAGPPSQFFTSSVTIDQGEAVTFTNLDFIAHDVTAQGKGPDGKPLFASALTNGGGSNPVSGTEFLTTGDYPFHCSVHPFMTATLKVTANGTPKQRPAAPPPDTTPPSAPTLSTTSVVPTRISLAWTAAVDDVSSQVSYTLLADGSTVNEGLIGFRGVTLAYFEPSSTHVFKVIARDRSGNTSESNTLTVTTPPAQEANAPGAPSNLRLSSETSAPEIWLDWDAASDDTDAPGDLLYEVHVNGVRVSTGIGNVEDIVYCQVTGENRIAVRAIDTSGNVSAFSNEIVFVC